MSANASAGQQPERTLLAWHRTCLTLVLASAVAVRLAAEVLGAPVLLLGAIGIATALAASRTAARRYRSAHAAVTSDVSTGLDGTPLAWLTAALVTTGLASGIFVVGAALR